jgi:hypothetical protein
MCGVAERRKSESSHRSCNYIVQFFKHILSRSSTVHVKR